MNSEDQRLAIAKTLGFDISYVEDALERFRDRDGYPDAIFQLAKIPDWPTNLNAAIQLCDVLKAKGWNCKIYRFAQVGTLWAVELINETEKNAPIVVTNSLSSAICEAFLKVKGLWTE
jgi:hypothetical protein